VSYLAAGMHPGVGAPSYGQRRRGREVQQQPERGLDNLLDRPAAWLAGPAGKA